MKPRSVFCVILNITDAIVINAQDAAGRMPIRVSAKCLTLLRGDHLCDTCSAQLRSWACCKGNNLLHLHHAKRFTTILLWRPPCTSTWTSVSWNCSPVRTGTGQARLCASIQETRSVTSDLGCHGSSTSGVGSRAGDCAERRGQHQFWHTAEGVPKI